LCTGSAGAGRDRRANEQCLEKAILQKIRIEHAGLPLPFSFFRNGALQG
jgi:hypothetical protein